MRIAILGKGNMGAPLARLIEAAGHQVEAFASTDDPLEALAAADLTLLAVKYEQARALAAQPGVAEALAGKTLVDLTNPLAPDFMSLTIGHSTSAAEEIARALPASTVVKAFNTIFAAVLAGHAGGTVSPLPVFVAGDDPAAVESVAGLVRDIGMTAIPAGGLTNARYLEPMTEMMIQLGYGLGHGDRIGFALVAAG
ncbi:NADPH-dependent F420 reductase [Pseudoroseicyclus tamaricis]|uniref:NADP oxidoreductase n=1 Tax=Pseudoroseicyclus tamaricis TaxID=2705421 RepID=A0A6B2JTA0_9RHOB|nr:NAD(P)-binding domain-containing protein [Pseudoroseicyclus tamaricis]NDV01777.1 NADP oxidoreductase [Pseudoroseicyclus tamaricis]